MASLDTSDLPEDVRAELVAVAGEPLLRARTVGAERTFAAPSMVEFEDGPWAVRTVTAAEVHLTAQERWLIGAQLAVGDGPRRARARWRCSAITGPCSGGRPRTP